MSARTPRSKTPIPDRAVGAGGHGAAVHRRPNQSRLDRVDRQRGGRHYRIERCVGAGCGSFTEVATATGITYNDTGLAAGTSYSYRVRAAEANDNTSGYSNTASAATAAADTQAPTAPSGLTATLASSGGQINLAWTASTDNVAVVDYRVERCSGAGCSASRGSASPRDRRSATRASLPAPATATVFVQRTPPPTPAATPTRRAPPPRAPRPCRRTCRGPRRSRRRRKRRWPIPSPGRSSRAT